MARLHSGGNCIRTEQEKGERCSNDRNRIPIRSGSRYPHTKQHRTGDVRLQRKRRSAFRRTMLVVANRRRQAFRRAWCVPWCFLLLRTCHKVDKQELCQARVHGSHDKLQGSLSRVERRLAADLKPRSKLLRPTFKQVQSLPETTKAQNSAVEAAVCTHFLKALPRLPTERVKLNEVRFAWQWRVPLLTSHRRGQSW